MKYWYHNPFFFFPDDGGGEGGEGVTLPSTLDEALKLPGLQAELDRRMAQAMKTAKAKWEKEQNMTAEQLAEQKLQERTRDVDAREAALKQREMRSSAIEALGKDGLPASLADALDYTSEDTVKATMASVAKSFRDSVQAAVTERMKGTPPAAGGAPQVDWAAKASAAMALGDLSQAAYYTRMAQTKG